jgi:hypothetical protein
LDEPVKVKTHIFTVGRDQDPLISNRKGTIQVGELTVSAIQSTELKNNLLSATQLSREYGVKQTIEPWTSKLTLSKDERVIATGKYNPVTQLIEIENSIPFSQAKTMNTTVKKTTNGTNDWITIHRKLGRVSDTVLRKTVKATTGIELKNRFDILPCQDC